MDLYPFFIFCAPNFIRYSKILASAVGIKTFMKYFCELSSFILDTLERVVAVSIVFKRQNSASLNQQKVGLVTTAIAKCRSLFWIFYRKSLMESDISAWVLVFCYQKRLVRPNAKLFRAKGHCKWSVTMTTVVRATWKLSARVASAGFR